MDQTTPTAAPAAESNEAKMARATSKIMGIPMPEEKPAAGTELPPTQGGETEQPEGTELGQTAEQGADPGEAGQAGSEVEEIEFDGVKFALPKEHIQKVKDALMRTSDYTQKTQEVAERARMVSAQEKMFQAQAQFHKESIDDIATIRAYDQAIAQYANVNWLGMPSEEAMRTKIQYDQLKDGRDRAQQQLNAKWSTFNTNRQQQLKELERASRSEIAKRIMGFNETQERELKDYARSRGYQDAAIEQLMFNPTDAEMIWKAQQYDRLQAQKGTINQRANKAPPIVRPGNVQQAKNQDARLMDSFKGAKTKQQKEALGGQLLARKMRII